MIDDVPIPLASVAPTKVRDCEQLGNVENSKIFCLPIYQIILYLRITSIDCKRSSCNPFTIFEEMSRGILCSGLIMVIRVSSCEVQRGGWLKMQTQVSSILFTLCAKTPSIVTAFGYRILYCLRIT